MAKPTGRRNLAPTCDEEFPKRLRRLRLEAGLSQREISEQGVSFTFISRLETGDRNPSDRAIRALAQKLGTTPEYLAWGRGRSEAYSERERAILARIAEANHEELVALNQKLDELRTKDSS